MSNDGLNHSRRENNGGPHPSPGSGEQCGPGVDATLKLLADGRRRVVLDYLRGSDGVEHRVEAVVDGVAGGSGADRSAVEASLHHVHLPKLDAAGAVDYDPDRGVVRYRPSDQLEAFLDLALREGPQ